jgi:hypothetical protein
MNKGINFRLCNAALNAMMGYETIDDPNIANELQSESDPLSLLIEKEEIEIKQSRYQQLSSEAKQVISIVLNTPTEIFEMISSKKGRRINKSKVEAMLAKQWKDKRHAKNVISEIEDFTKIL